MYIRITRKYHYYSSSIIMEQTFETILTSLLESYENNPAQDIDALIEEKSKEWGLTEEQAALLKETNGYIDGFTENAASLEEAKADGKSRKRWMLEKIDNMTEGRSEEEKAQIVSTISETNEKMIEETTAKE